jgi:hypothetical protein
MDTSKERPQEDMVKDAVLHHNRRSTMGNKEWPDQWKVPVVVKKGTKGKEQEEVGTSRNQVVQQQIPGKHHKCTQPTESAMTVKKQRKKETIPRASVLGTECAEGTNGEAQKKDNIPSQERKWRPTRGKENPAQTETTPKRKSMMQIGEQTRR